MGEITGAIYGGALYAAACEEQKADIIYEQVRFLRQFIKDCPDFVRLIESKALSIREKKGIIDASLANKTDVLIINTIKISLDKKREKFLSDILECYEKRYMDYAGIKQGKLITAVPAKADQVKALEKILSKKTGNKIILKNITDPDIIGGAVIKIDNITIDGSIKKRLAAMRTHISKNGAKAGDVL